MPGGEENCKYFENVYIQKYKYKYEYRSKYIYLYKPGIEDMLIAVCATAAWTKYI